MVPESHRMLWMGPAGGRPGPLLALLCALATAAPGAEAPPPPLPPGVMNLQISHVGGEFRLVEGTQDTWELGPFELQASCPLRVWRVMCEFTPLSSQEGATLPYERMQLLITGPDKAALTVACVPGPMVVMEGGIGTPIGPTGRCSFAVRMKTDWEDPAATYAANMRFSYFVAP